MGFGRSDWLGLATAIAAWYASFAVVTDSTFGRTVLPVLPLRHRAGRTHPGDAPTPTRRGRGRET